MGRALVGPVLQNVNCFGVLADSYPESNEHGTVLPLENQWESSTARTVSTGITKKKNRARICEVGAEPKGGRGGAL